MLFSRLGSSDPTFDLSREPKDSFLITALKVLISNDKFINSVQKDLNKCRHSQETCLISSLQIAIDQYKKGLIINTLPLRQSLAALGQEERKFTLDSADWDIVETMSYILNAIHIKALNFPCNMQNNEALAMSCNETCPFHSFFYLGVDENHICECGNESTNPWDSTNICQYFNINEIFEDYNQETSKEMSRLPNFIIKEKGVEGNSQRFLGKIVKRLEERLRDAKCDSCFLDDCQVRSSKISFRLTKCPEVYLINLIWENDNPMYLQIMLATASVSSTLMIDEIYGIGPKTRYNLKGIAFQRASRYEYAFRNGDRWNFSGLHENSGWYELLQEVTVLKYLPVCLVYEKAPLSQPYNFGIKVHKFMFAEKFASECEEYELLYGSQVVGPEKKVSGLFAKVKKNMMVKQQDLNFGSLMKLNRIDEESLPVSRKIQKPIAESNFPSITEVKNNSSSFKEEKKASQNYQNSSYNRKPVSEPMLNISRVNSVIKKNLSPIENKSTPTIEKTWKCKCGFENSDIWEVCSKCYELKPGVEGWVCEYCKAKNDPEFLYKCTTCEEINQRSRYSDKKLNEIKNFDIKNEPNEKKFFFHNSNSYLIDEERKKTSQDFENKAIWSKNPNIFFSDLLRNEKKSDIWDCKCGSSNAGEWEICQKCDEIKPGLGGWVCRFCKSRNPSENVYRCNQCDTYKNDISAKEQEYWSCKNCKTANISYAYICEECGKRKDQFFDSMQQKDSPRDGSERLKAQIWKCPKCYIENPIEKEKCSYCKLQNPYVTPKKDLDVEEKVKVNTWECKCGKTNEETRAFCSRCYDKKIEGNEKIRELHEYDYKSIGYQSSDTKKNQESAWKCYKCGEVNEEWKAFCKTCRLDKFENKIVENITEEYWKCARCLTENDSNNQNICSKCKTARVERQDEVKSVEALSSRCKECFKDIDVVMCPNCKEGVRLRANCIKCSRSLREATRCFSCAEKERKKLKKGSGLSEKLSRKKFDY